jgi:hypothetical protein
MNLNEIVKDVRISKVCSIKADADSTTIKTVTLNVYFSGVTLKDVFSKAVGGAVIQWQNGPGRKGFDKLTNGQVVNIEFKAPGRTIVDPETEMINKLGNMTKDEQNAYIKTLMEKAAK